MYTGILKAFAYYRLSVDDKNGGRESESISNQRLVVHSFCERNNIVIVREFIDDGYSGANFERPDFQNMLNQIELHIADIVVTKDLSRLGRDMTESSYYAETYLPEKGMRFLTATDNFDSQKDNPMAPFQFAMNEVYLRDCSRKIKTVLKHKRESGQYCTCPPYGYKKDPTQKGKLVPDEITSGTVKKIFQYAAKGYSCIKIATILDKEHDIPPLKYRALYRDNFSPEGASHVSDLWNHITIKRILKNPVYLGHTFLGKTQKISFKSKKKMPVPKDDWTVFYDTHEPLVSQTIFDQAQLTMKHHTKLNESYDSTRLSMFKGIAFCAECGHSVCSAGTVYKGERDKYWHLACNKRNGSYSDPCKGVRIRYSDLVELVIQDLNYVINISDDEINQIIEYAIQKYLQDHNYKDLQLRQEKAQTRLSVIDKIIIKLYADNAEGKISNERLINAIDELEKETIGLKAILAQEYDIKKAKNQIEQNYKTFFNLVKDYTTIKELNRDILMTFIDRIEIGPKIYKDGTHGTPRGREPYQQTVHIYYKFVGNIMPLETGITSN